MNDHDPDRHITDNDAYLAKKRERFKEHQARMTMEKGKRLLHIGDRVSVRDCPSCASGRVTESKMDGGQAIHKVNGHWHLYWQLVHDETFGQFITRRTGFGRTSWWQFGLIVAFSAVLLTIGFLMEPDGTGAKAVSIFCGFLSPALLLWGTWRNFKGKQA